MTTKFCPPCNRTLPTSAFGYKDKATGRLQSKCKECSRAYAKQHYEGNKDVYLKKAQVNGQVSRERNRELVQALLRDESCSQCKSTQDLSFYAEGGLDSGLPVHMAVHGGLSEAAVLEAVDRSKVWCAKCLGQRFLTGLLPWQGATSEQRQVMQKQRADQGHVPIDPRLYKKYRTLGDNAPSRAKAREGASSDVTAIAHGVRHVRSKEKVAVRGSTTTLNNV